MSHLTTIQRSALVEYSAEQMFALVNDIGSYPEFMSGCESARVISESEQELVGELCLARAGISQCFTTRNMLDRPASITMELVEGNFTEFSADWKFEALEENACKVSFGMKFKFDSGLVDFAAEKMFNGIANNLISAIIRRADKVYGKP